MPEQELNKKLAEWAGLSVATVPDYTGFYLFGYKGICYTANFTQSLDACFKWLVPKLENHWYQYCITLNNVRDGWACQLFRSEESPFVPKRIDEIAETPALALCKAIEKLIDGEKGENNAGEKT